MIILAVVFIAAVNVLVAFAAVEGRRSRRAAKVLQQQEAGDYLVAVLDDAWQAGATLSTRRAAPRAAVVEA